MQSFYLKIETSPPNHLYQTATGSSHPISPKSHAVHHPAKTSCLLYGKNFRQGWLPWATVAFNVGNATSAQGTSTWIARLPSRIGHPFWYTRWVQSLNNFAVTRAKWNLWRLDGSRYQAGRRIVNVGVGVFTPEIGLWSCVDGHRAIGWS